MNDHAQTESFFQLIKIALAQIKSKKAARCAVHCTLYKTEQNYNPANNIVNAKIANAKLRQNLPAGVKPHEQEKNAPEVKKHRVFCYAFVVFVG
jgi:hypothetical protein